MKKARFILAALSVLLLTAALASCGGNDPKALAKQTYDLLQQSMAALLNPSKAAELEKKMDAIGKKVEKLSDKDKAIYEEELLRLAGGALGGLFDAASKLMENTSAQDVEKALDAAKQAVDILNSLGK